MTPTPALPLRGEILGSSPFKEEARRGMGLFNGVGEYK